MEVDDKLQFMLNHMSQEGKQKAYALVQRLWLRYGTSARTHTIERTDAPNRKTRPH